MVSMEYPHYFRQPRVVRTENDFCIRMAEIPPQNIVVRLMHRETWGTHRRVGTERYLQRSMYQNVCPNFTITHVDKPPCFLRKFTPDGKHCVAFSQDQMSIEVYKFQGPQAANSMFADKLLQDWFHREPGTTSKKGEPKVDSYCKGPYPDHFNSEDNGPAAQRIRARIFDCFFKLKWRVSVAPQGEQLNRECSLFTENSKYLIVGSATYVQDEYMQHSANEVYRNNESVQPNARYPLEDYSIHVVDIKNGFRTDTCIFKADKIFLSHNQGMYLYGTTLAVLSVQHQTVHIFHITNGQFHEIRTLGRFCHEDDELLTSTTVPSFVSTRGRDEAFIGALKHRLLTFIYKRAYAKSQDPVNPDLNDLVRFWQYFEQLRKLKIWKMQLLDEDHLLLKYASEDVVTLRCGEPNSQHCIFVVYNIPETTVIAVFENTSEDLVELFENFTDNFRNSFMNMEARFLSSPANNMYARQIQQKFRQTITSARFGGPVEATKRILAQIPISAQSFTSSPYVDQALFSYDDHRVSVMERPKACGEIPIRFYGRDSGLFKFQIHAGIHTRGSTNSGRRLVAFTFHPSAPFAISVQRANAEYLIHFHIRIEPHSVLNL